MHQKSKNTKIDHFNLHAAYCRNVDCYETIITFLIFFAVFDVSLCRQLVW